MIHKKNILMFIMLAVFIFQCSDNNLPDDGTVKIIHNESKIWGNSPQISLELVNTIGGLDEDDDNDIFFNPFDVVLDASDNLYVLDTGHHRIQKYGPDRKYLSTIGREGDGPGELKGPVHLNIVNNELVVNSSREQKVHYFTLDGKYISTTRVIRNTGLFIPLGSGKMAISDQGRARRPEPNNLMIDILDNDGGFINAFMTPKDYGTNECRRIRCKRRIKGIAGVEAKLQFDTVEPFVAVGVAEHLPTRNVLYTQKIAERRIGLDDH